MALDEILLGGAIRFVQALALAAPTILVGLFVAGVFERLFGYDTTRRLFGGKGIKSLALAWLMGMLLPVCSLGVIPVLPVMKRAGLGGGTLLAFALAAPLFNPISLLYGLTLSRPVVVVTFAFCSLLVVTVVGAIWDRLFPDTATPAAPPPPVAPGFKRMSSIGVAVLREFSGPTLGYILLGAAGSALLGMVLPHGALQRAMNGDNPLAPLSMAAVSIPAYATPMLAISQLGSMFQHGNSVGAAYVLLTFGTGLNLGLLAWMVAQFGWRRAGVWFGLMVVLVLGLAYAVDKPLYPDDVDPADHTHAFDIYCSPFAGGGNAWQMASQKLQDAVRPYEWTLLLVTGVLCLVAIALRFADPHQRLERWLQTRPERRPPLDIRIPAAALGFVFLLVLVMLSGAGCYIYYPEPIVVFEELQAIRADAIVAAKQGNVKQADHWIGLWDEWTRRLEVGEFLRRGRVSDYQRMKARILREKLELLRHEVEDGDRAAAERLTRQVQDAHNRLRQAFLS
jgi:uncharacterized protein